METETQGVSPRDLVLARTIEALRRQRNAAMDEAAEAVARGSIQDQAIAALTEANKKLKERVESLEKSQQANEQESA